MTLITVPPRPTDAHPATVPGGFSHSRPSVADDAPPFRSQLRASAYSRIAPFLAPLTAEEQNPAPRASDCGDVAMRRLRHPFTVAADTAS